MWYCPLGFVITFVIGLFLSFCLNRMLKKPKVELDLNLYFPLVAKRIRRKRREPSETSEKEVSKNTITRRKYIFTINSTGDTENTEEINITKV